MKHKFFIPVVTLLSALVLTACSEGTTKENETVDIKELVQDYSVGNIENETASINSKQLMVKDSEGKETFYDLPQEEFFVSIAPYVNETHP